MDNGIRYPPSDHRLSGEVDLSGDALRPKELYAHELGLALLGGMT